MGRLEAFRHVISEESKIKGVFQYAGMLRTQIIEKKALYNSLVKSIFA